MGNRYGVPRFQIYPDLQIYRFTDLTQISDQISDFSRRFSDFPDFPDFRFQISDLDLAFAYCIKALKVLSMIGESNTFQTDTIPKNRLIPSGVLMVEIL